MSGVISFKIKIGETTHLLPEVDKSLYISEVKGTVEMLSGVPKAQQKWVYQGRILNDSTTIQDSGIAEDNTVIVVKTAAVASSSTSSSQSSNVPSASRQQYPSSIGSIMPPPPPSAPSITGYGQMPPAVNTAQFDQAMLELLSNTNEAVVQGAVNILFKIASNIAGHPMEEKYRRLNRTNAAFSKKLGTVIGGPSCMMGLGFRLEGDEWVLVPTAAAWENLMACRAKLEKFLTKLNQSMAAKESSVTASAPSTTASTAAPSASTAGTLSAAGGAAAPPPAGPSPVVDPASLLALQQLLHAFSMQQGAAGSPGAAAEPTSESTSEGQNTEGER